MSQLPKITSITIGYCFKSDGLYHTKSLYNEDIGEYGQSVSEKCTTIDDILHSFMYSCEIENATLFQILEALLPVKNIIGPMLHIDLDSHLATKSKKPDADQAQVKGSYLEVYQTHSFNKYRNATQYALESSTSIHIIEPNTKYPFSIALSPIYTFGHLNVKLNKSFDVYGSDFTMPPNAKPISNLLFESSVGYTTWDIISGIVWEIGFFGGPKDQATMSDDLQLSADDVVDVISDDINETSIIEDVANGLSDLLSGLGDLD